MANLPEIGGATIHNIIRPTKDALFERQCKVCGSKFVTTLSENSVSSDGALYRRTEYPKGSFLRSIFGCTDVVNCTYEKVKVLCSVCPNCGFSEEVGVIPSGQTETHQHYSGHI